MGDGTGRDRAPLRRGLVAACAVPLLGIALLASIWGGSYLFNEIALRELGPGMIVWSRVTLGALTIWPLAILPARPVPSAAT